MLKTIKNPIYFLLFLIIIALLLRLLPFYSKEFNSDEARIAFRASNLAKHGTDELGRKLPFIFNSLTDYQLPVTSYFAALGVFVFGKTEFGVRIPFIIVGVFLSLLTYKISQVFSDKKKFGFFSALVIVFSPVLIFLSKIPNETILLTFLITLLFYLLIREERNFILITVVVALSLLTSKLSWFITFPFLIFTLIFYQKNAFRSTVQSLILPLICLLLTIITVIIFLQIPQSQRSLKENNFTVFSSMSIQNGINRLRGEGLAKGWPNILETLLFNKTDFLIIGFIHWLSNLQPSVYFGQLDEANKIGLSQMGALSKILIIPFIFGVIYLIRKGESKGKLLFPYFFILTFPASFIYPDYSINLVVLTLPFIALIIAFGFMQFGKTISIAISFLMLLELIFNFLNFKPPSLIKPISQDIYKESIEQNIAVSDDLSEDIIPLIEWYAPINYDAGYQDVAYPYKFHQYTIRNLNHSIKILSSSNKLYPCGDNTLNSAIISRRDKEKSEIYDIKIKKIYLDNFNKEMAYVLEQSLCIE